MPPRGRASGTGTQRLESLDSFRGFVILAMIFVNFCAGIEAIPAWMKHMPSKTDGYTFVDLVFPGFLFIVGVAIPLSLNKRLVIGDTALRLFLGRIVPRTASLVFLGVVYVNMDRFSPEATGVSEAAWKMLFFLCVIILWMVTPAGLSEKRRRLLLVLRVLAAVCMAWLIFAFRQKTEDGSLAWFRPSWWGILGMIGGSYLAASLAYLLTRGNPAALMGVLGFTIALFIGGRHGSLPGFLGPIDGVVSLGHLFGLKFVIFFGAGLYAAGQLIRPLHGIHKDWGTDAWALVSAGECCLMFAAFYYLIDARGWRRWASFLLPAGVNPLTAYILPDIFGAVLDITHGWNIFWKSHEGSLGVLNCAVLTALMLVLTGLFTRFKLVLKL